MKKQYEILNEIQNAGYNVVTCGNCGEVLLHETGVDTIVCVHPNCGFEGDICHFPDLFTSTDKF